jgi:hypothetical protein
MIFSTIGFYPLYTEGKMRQGCCCLKGIVIANDTREAMQHAIKLVIFFVTIIIFLILFHTSLFSSTNIVYAANKNSVHLLAVSTRVPISTTQQSSNGDNNNTAIPVAIINLIGPIISSVALIIGAFVTILLPRHLEQKKLVKERIQNTLEKKAASAKALMKQAGTDRERFRAYRRSIQGDSRIATLQILDMNSPLNLISMYIQVRLHQDTTSTYKIQSNLADIEEHHDPNSLLQAEQKDLERRIAMAQDPEDAIAQYKRCVIVGDPGAGKTTLLKYLTLKLVSYQSQSLPDIPIHIELNAFASSKYKNLLDFAAFTWETRYNFPRSEALGFIKRSLHGGRVILLLDALDEALAGKTTEDAENSYQHLLELIMDLATLYQQSIIVVTARKAAYNQRIKLKGFTELDILDFRSEDIKRFIDLWFINHPDKQKRGMGNDLNILLERNLRLRTLAANPLLLSLIAIVYDAQLELPDRRTELYKQCIEILLTKWDASRNVNRRREFKSEQKRPLLGEVAWYFHLRGQRYLPEEELLKVIADFLPSIGLSKEQCYTILQEITSANGLLKEQARGWQGFLHLTLQEYFVAQYMSDYNQLSMIIQYRHQSWWEEVILLYAGLTPDASPLLEILAKEDQKKPIEQYTYEEILKSDLILISRCLISRPTIKDLSLREKIVDRLFNVLLRVPYSSIRQIIAENLVDAGRKDINTILLKLLASSQTEINVRQCIAYALIRQGKDFATQALIKTGLDKSAPESLTRVISYGLFRLGERLSTNTLLQMLFDPYNKEDFIMKGIMATLYDRDKKTLISEIQQKLSDSHIRIEPHVRIRVENFLVLLQQPLEKIRKDLRDWEVLQ